MVARVPRPVTYDPFKKAWRYATDEEVAADAVGLGGPSVVVPKGFGAIGRFAKRFLPKAAEPPPPVQQLTREQLDVIAGRSAASPPPRAPAAVARSVQPPPSPVQLTPAQRDILAGRGGAGRVIVPAVVGAVGGQVIEDVLDGDDDDGGNGGAPTYQGPEYVPVGPDGLPVPGALGVGLASTAFRAIASNPLLTLAGLVVAGATLREVVNAVQLNDKMKAARIGNHFEDAGRALMLPADVLRAPVDVIKAATGGDMLDRILDTLRRN